MDSGIYQGWEATIDYDSILAKLISFGADRAQAIARMNRAIREYRITGIRPNLALFAEILSNPEFLAGNTCIGLVEEMQKRRGKIKESSYSLFSSHALAAALAFADSADPSLQPDLENENPWKLSGRPGFSTMLRR